MESQKTLDIKGINLDADQKDLIHSEKWNLLIILDDCRYDYFKETYYNYLIGELLEAESPAADTRHWLKTTFPGSYEDSIYIAGNPAISDVQLGWIAEDHFPKLYPVFSWGRERVNGIEAVPPWNVSKAVEMMITKYPGRKIIAHYFQPHYPFIGDPKFVINNTRPSLEARFLSNPATKTFIRMIKAKNPWIKKLMGGAGRRADDALQVESTSCPSLLRRGVIDIEFFKKAYEGNLNLVLKHVSELVRKIEKHMPEIIITSDHGELFRHPFSRSDNFDRREFPELYEVPWLVLEDISD